MPRLALYGDVNIAFQIAMQRLFRFGGEKQAIEVGRLKLLLLNPKGVTFSPPKARKRLFLFEKIPL